MSAETYRGIDLDRPVRIIPAEVVEQKTAEIGVKLAIVSFASEGIPEGLIINPNLPTVPVLSTNHGKVAAISEGDGSLVLYQLLPDMQTELGQCQLKDGQIVKPGYLRLSVVDFRFAGGEDAGVSDIRTDPIRRNSTIMFAIAAKCCQNPQQREELLRTINNSIII